MSKPEQLLKFDDSAGPLELHGACDATWALDKKEQRSMGGVVLMLAGGAIYYRTNLQPTIALLSTEAKFMTIADAGKAALYIRWILTELQQEVDTATPIKTTENDGIPRNILDPTTIKADNAGAVKIASAQQPTSRLRHVEMKYFAILQ